MTNDTLSRLPDRGVIALTGADARSWLDNLVTNDLGAFETQPSVFTALLSPQGKILFEFFVVRHGDGLLLDVHASSVAALIKRLSLYKLRAQIALADVSEAWAVVWRTSAGSADALGKVAGRIISADPRAPHDLWRGLVPAASAQDASSDYMAARVRIGLAEAPHDYALGDTFPHEANFDLRHGVSFTKGCFVGQEVVARMQNKSVVRKRVVRVTSAAALTSGTDITAGVATIGKVGSVSGNAGLALLRLDRVAEALGKSQPIRAGESAIEIEAAAVAAYHHAVKNRPEIDL